MKKDHALGKLKSLVQKKWQMHSSKSLAAICSKEPTLISLTAKELGIYRAGEHISENIKVLYRSNQTKQDKEKPNGSPSIN